jgi:hypothetical protein
MSGQQSTDAARIVPGQWRVGSCDNYVTAVCRMCI